MRVALEPLGQGREVWRNVRHSLSGEAAERALIAAMAGPVLRRRALIAGVGAELRIGAEDRLELGGDRRVISARESGRGKGWRRRGGEQLDDERERDEKRGQARAPRILPRGSPVTGFSAAPVHGDIL